MKVRSGGTPLRRRTRRNPAERPAHAGVPASPGRPGFRPGNLPELGVPVLLRPVGTRPTGPFRTGPGAGTTARPHGSAAATAGSGAGSPRRDQPWERLPASLSGFTGINDGNRTNGPGWRPPVLEFLQVRGRSDRAHFPCDQPQPPAPEKGPSQARSLAPGTTRHISTGAQSQWKYGHCNTAPSPWAATSTSPSSATLKCNCSDLMRRIC